MMHFILQQNHLFYLLCICITQTISTPIETFPLIEQSNGSEENGTVNQDHSFHWTSVTLSTTTQYSSTSHVYVKRQSSDMNLKIIVIIVACMVFGFGFARICLIICKSSRSSNNVLSNRRMSIVRPQIATITNNSFKPDLPPAYAEAVANIDNDESKLPSYDELRNANT